MRLIPAWGLRRRTAPRHPYHDPGDLATEHSYFGLTDRIREDILHLRSYPLAGTVQRTQDLARAIMPGRRRCWRRTMLTLVLLIIGAGEKP